MWVLRNKKRDGVIKVEVGATHELLCWYVYTVKLYNISTKYNVLETKL